MLEVVVVGNTLVDLNFDLSAEYLHNFGSEAGITFPFGTKLEAKGYALNAGGSGANVAVGLAKAGIETTFFTGLSTDTLGGYLKDQLEAEERLKLTASQDDRPSNISVVLRIKTERTIISAHLNHYDYETFTLPSSGHLHIAPLPTSQDNFFEHLSQHRAKTSQPLSCNPSLEMIGDRSRHFMIALKTMAMLFVNQEEAAALARLPRRTGGAELVRSLSRLGPKIVVVTCGEKGAYAGSGDEVYYAPLMSDRSSRVDATGTGDAFTSGFLAGYLVEPLENEQQQLNRALAFAALNSGSVVTEVGGQNGLLSLEELERGETTVTLKKIEDFEK